MEFVRTTRETVQIYTHNFLEEAIEAFLDEDEETLKDLAKSIDIDLEDLERVIILIGEWARVDNVEEKLESLFLLIEKIETAEVNAKVNI